MSVEDGYNQQENNDKISLEKHIIGPWNIVRYLAQETGEDQIEIQKWFDENENTRRLVANDINDGGSPEKWIKIIRNGESIVRKVEVTWGDATVGEAELIQSHQK